MSAVAHSGPVVDADGVVFSLPAGDGLRGVTLVHGLPRPRSLPFERRDEGWELRFERPEADRIEYLLELVRTNGHVELAPDPTNPRRARGPFGDKSVVEWPEYEEPAWVADDEARPGELRGLRFDSRRLRGPIGGLLWSAHDTDPAEPLPLLVVQDGPEYAEYSHLLRLLDHLVDFGEVPEFRAALLAPPGDRNEAYSASARYGNALAAELLPSVVAQAPTDREPVLLGASLGALAALHAHWLHPGLFAGLFLQSGSFFRKALDAHEFRFRRWSRITRFVGRVHGGRGYVARVPTVITCGTVEENLANNRSLARALGRTGFDVNLVEHPDAHNWTSWRDVLHPHLADLLLRAWRP